MKLLGLSLIAIPSLLLIPLGVGVLLVAFGGLVVGPLVAGSFANDRMGPDEPVPEPAWHEAPPRL
jgi:hypothetical protein